MQAAALHLIEVERRCRIPHAVYERGRDGPFEMDDAYFTERPDRCSAMSASTDQKMTTALPQLCYGLPAGGPAAEYCRTNESKNKECRKLFASAVVDLFEDEWLHL
jgi:hypothetical protein